MTWCTCLLSFHHRLCLRVSSERNILKCRSVLFSEVVTSPNTFQSPAMMSLVKNPTTRSESGSSSFPPRFLWKRWIRRRHVSKIRWRAFRAGEPETSPKPSGEHLERVHLEPDQLSVRSASFTNASHLRWHHQVSVKMTQWSESSFLYQSVLLLL